MTDPAAAATGTPGLVVVTPWYPEPGSPYHGVFVRESLRALRHDPDDVLVVHLRNVPPADVGPVSRQRTPEGELLRVDVPVAPGTSRAATAVAQRDALLGHVPEVRTWRTVHAHVGMPAGWAVAQVLDERCRLVVTEHATYLPTILRTPVGARMYAELLERTDRLLTVGEVEARALRRQFPRSAGSVVAGGNAVDDERFVLGPAPSGRLDRWLFVGNLVPRKRVGRALEAFASWVQSRPRDTARFTIVGQGPEQPALERRARELGVASQVRFAGSASPDEVVDHLHRHDLLVHLADYETFGLTVVEAAMAGLPVVVTACGGPSETLDHAVSAGMARLVPVSPSPGAVVTAVADLERVVPSADREAVRGVLVDRYGADAFGARLRRVLDGRPPAAPAEPARTVLGVTLSPDGSTVVARAHQEVLRRGHRAALLTDQRDDAVSADGRVQVVDLRPWVSRAPHHVVPDVLVHRLPTAVLRATRDLVDRVAALRGPHQRSADRGVHALSALLARTERVAAGVDRKVLHPLVHARLDPPRVERHVRTRLTSQLAALSPDVVLVGDAESRRLAQHVARTTGATLVEGGDVVALLRALGHGSETA